VAVYFEENSHISVVLQFIFGMLWFVSFVEEVNALSPLILFEQLPVCDQSNT
jgi:hypothetical protein